MGEIQSFQGIEVFCHQNDCGRPIKAVLRQIENLIIQGEDALIVASVNRVRGCQRSNCASGYCFKQINNQDEIHQLEDALPEEKVTYIDVDPSKVVLYRPQPPYYRG